MALVPTKKITALAPATLPLTGDEELENVQLGNSRKARTRDFVLPTDSLITLSGMGGSLPGSRQLVSSSTVAVLDGGPGSTVSLQTADVAMLQVGVQLETLPAGSTDNLVLDLTTGFLELDTTAGDAVVTGITPPALNGQIIIVSNTGANLLTLAALNGGSVAANQVRLPADLTLTQYGGVTLRYSTALALWIPMS